MTNLRCVYLTVIEPNAGAIRAYEKAGFKRQGMRRNSNQWLGETVNEVLMDAVPEEFEGPSLVKAQFRMRTSGARCARRAYASVGRGPWPADFGPAEALGIGLSGFGRAVAPVCSVEVEARPRLEGTHGATRRPQTHENPRARTSKTASGLGFCG
ncbi:GNAT family N-acetyltransferase [Nocardiopsis dassonvillei]|uniref:GNAT family N-acetyltransferase n=2 Tax=Nocardiopsidaceae TaxID=83676 RepID=UPI000F6F5307|nr:GNAT family protein [Nocardiopsis dassonvillei]VEI90381.1 Uncharacterised protein [Nocardiopsis dassonvillei]